MGTNGLSLEGSSCVERLQPGWLPAWIMHLVAIRAGWWLREHVAMAARGLRAQAAGCGVSNSGDGAVAAMRALAAGNLECPVGECHAARPLQHARGLAPLLTSWKLAHLPRPSGKTVLFSPVSKCTFIPPTEAGWAKTEEQPEARTPGFKCDVLRLNSFPKVVLWRALWQPSQNNQ